jgi:hypothetical protein
MTLGLSNMNASPTSTLSLGLTPQSQPESSDYGAQYNTAYGGASPFTAGILGGAGISAQQYQQYQQPIAPPSDTQVLAAMLGTLQPIDRFIISQNMPVFIEMLSNLTTYSILNVLKNCTFTLDEEGTMALDVTSMPSDLQTLSAENIIAQLNSLQNTSMQIIQKAEGERQQILQLADQSLLQGALSSALADPGMLEGVGQAAGGFINRSIFGRG